MSNHNKNLLEQLLAIEEACRDAQRQVQVNNGTVNKTGKFTYVGQLSDINQNSYSLFKTLR